MKKPNYGQQQKMKKLNPVELAAYCQENGFPMPQTSIEVAPLSSHPVAPENKPEVVLTPVSDHEIEQPTETSNSGTNITIEAEAPKALEAVAVAMSEAKWEGADDSEEEVAAEGILKSASRQFFALKNRLEQNAAHSVLNWDEMSDLEATLFPWYSQKVEAPLSPKVPTLPEGQKWALVIGEPLNRTQKFIRFVDEAHDAPHKMLYVNISASRMMGRKLRVKLNPNENQGGYVIA